MKAEEKAAWAAMAQFGPKETSTSSSGMVISSHPIASSIGRDILRAGGNAADAALATALAQTVVEPHMTTITGVLSLLYHDAASDTNSYVDGGMNRPLADLTGFSAADIRTGRGVAVPGWWAGFETSLADHGTMPKSQIMSPSIDLAREGFPIHPFLYGEMLSMCSTMGRTPEGREIFMPEGSLLSPGRTLYQKRASRTLERLRDEGNEFFYHGAFADSFVQTVTSAGGILTNEDMARYTTRRLQPIRGTYHGHEIVTSPPPDNGGLSLVQALNMFELLDLKSMGPPTESAESLYYMVKISETVKEEGSRLPDPSQGNIPLDTLLSKEYARMRLDLLRMEKKSPHAEAASAYPGTNHVTVVDGKGNIASLLHSCMSLPWSNGLFCEGVSVCAAGGWFLRHMPGPGERANTYSAPNIIFRQGKPVLTSGSPSVSLIANILQNTVNILDFDMPIQESVRRPRFGSCFLDPKPWIEADIDESIRDEVERLGQPLEVCSPWHFMNGSFEGISISSETGQMTACGDPRRNSMASGI